MSKSACEASRSSRRKQVTLICQPLFISPFAYTDQSTSPTSTLVPEKTVHCGRLRDSVAPHMSSTSKLATCSIQRVQNPSPNYRRRKTAITLSSRFAYARASKFLAARPDGSASCGMNSTHRERRLAYEDEIVARPADTSLSSIQKSRRASARTIETGKFDMAEKTLPCVHVSIGLL